ncbi:MAG TPA: 5'/3'-nucleotidase SurE [Anaerolineae bacterium]|jgi:5'-nucleotidase|nr:5'/3'-nucleotidase SurE [Anaerolineae bacterium]
MSNSAQILVSNDDGVQAPGLLALKQALESLGEVTVIAPERGWSAAGHTKTMHKPLRIWQVELADGSAAYTSSGTPSDCVALAVMEAIPVQPDLVVSGINSGANMGHDITYSGTVAAAMEGVIAELPAMAVSLDTSDEAADYGYAAHVAALLARQLLERGLPRQVLLNVNVPDLPPEEIKGIRITRLGQRVYRDVLVVRSDPRGRPYYWVGGDRPLGVAEDGTDVGALAEGYVSVTPLFMDMTAHHLLDEMRGWNLTLE